MDDTILIDDGVGIRREGPLECDVGIEFPVLVEINETKTIGESNRALRRLDVPTHQAKQSSLAAAIGADESDPHSGLDHQIELSEERSLADLVGNTLQLDQL